MSDKDIFAFAPIEFQLKSRRVGKAYLGPTSRTWQQFVANSGLGTDVVTFNITTPGLTTLMRKNVLINWPLRVRFTGVPVGPPGGPYSIIQPFTGDAPRALPVAQNVTSYSCQIGSQTVATQVSGQYVDAMFRYFKTIDERNTQMGTFPSYQDPLGAGSSTFVKDPGTYAAFTGTAKDPFLNGDQGRDHRGDYPFYLNPVNFPTNASTTQTVLFNSLEPQIGQSIWSQTSVSQEPGLWNTSVVTFSISLANPMNVWSHDITKTSGFTVQTDFYTAPILYGEFWSLPKAIMDLITFPIQYPMSVQTNYPQQSTAIIPSGGLVTVSFQNLTVNSIPDAVLLFLVPTPGQQLSSVTGENSGTIFAMNNYAGISRVPFSSITGPTSITSIVQVTFDNMPAQLSGMTAEQIYNTQVDNGLVNTSFSDWSEFGSVMKFYFGRDIQLKDGLVAGSKGNYNLTIQATFQNNFSQPLTFDPRLILLQNATFTVNRDINTISTNALTEAEVKSASVVPEPANMGAGLFGDIGRLSSFIPVIGQYASPILQGLGNLADAGINAYNRGGNMSEPQRLQVGMKRPRGGVRI